MEKLPANKTNLNKVIKWSNSRFNELKKDEVIEDILERIKAGKNGEWHYGTGAFSESSHLGQWSYDLIIKDGNFYLKENRRDKKRTFKLIVKPTKNKKDVNWRKLYDDYANYLDKQKEERLKREKPVIVKRHEHTYAGKKKWVEEFRRKKPTKRPKQSSLLKFLR